MRVSSRTIGGRPLQTAREPVTDRDVTVSSVAAKPGLVRDLSDVARVMAAEISPHPPRA
jgi:hypothetical protein